MNDLTECKTKRQDQSEEYAIDQKVQIDLGHRTKAIALLAQGASSSIYKVKFSNLPGDFAAKVMVSQDATDRRSVHFFERSAQAASLLNHPHLTTVYGLQYSNNLTPFVVMDLESGENLHSLVKRFGPLRCSDVIDIFIQVSEGLAYAHGYGVIHGNLKPSKLMIRAQESPNNELQSARKERGDQRGNSSIFTKILDCRLSQDFITAGSHNSIKSLSRSLSRRLRYKSPEQCRGENFDTRSDVFALGCIMYESLSGKAPAAANTMHEVLRKQLSEVPKPLDGLSIPDLGIVVARCLAKDPRKRYQSMQEVLADLMRIREHRKPLAGRHNFCDLSMKAQMQICRMFNAKQ